MNKKIIKSFTYQHHKEYEIEKMLTTIKVKDIYFSKKRKGE